LHHPNHSNFLGKHFRSESEPWFLQSLSPVFSLYFTAKIDCGSRKLPTVSAEEPFVISTNRRQSCNQDNVGDKEGPESSWCYLVELERNQENVAGSEPDPPNADQCSLK